MTNISKYYDLFSMYYDPEYPEAQKRANQTIKNIQLILDDFRKNNKIKTLDLCCGGGIFSFALAEQGFHVLGVDMLDSQIDKAKKYLIKRKDKSIKCEFVISDVMQLSLPTKEYDIAFLLGNSIAHFSVSDMFNLFKRVYTWLNTGGLFIIEYGDFILNLMQYQNVIFEGLSRDGKSVLSFHDRYDANNGFLLRRFCDLTSGETFLLKLFIWTPSVLRHIARIVGFKLHDKYVITHSSNIGERTWNIDVFIR